MMIIRPVKKQDLQTIAKCAMDSGPGLTHLPKRMECLEQKIECSLQAFSKANSTPEREEYFFVLADHRTEEIGGTCGIYSRTGAKDPLYAFRIETLPPLPAPLPLLKENRLLQVKAYQNGPTEICALYLMPHMRKGGFGKLLSLSRFLFIAGYPKRFTETVMANMRGIINNAESPFWNGLGCHFLPVSFNEVMAMRALSEDFLPQFLPKYPIYVSLLTEETKQSIAHTHPHTEPALKMLQKEGFRFINEIDPFDGGPFIAADTKEINTIKNSKVSSVKALSKELNSPERYLLSNDRIDFRACYGVVQVEDDGRIVISEEVAEGLQVQIGDPVRYIRLM